MKKNLDKWVHSFKSSCLCKHSYRTAGYAEEVAKKVYRERGVELHCYWCNICGKYHLTKRLPKNKKEENGRIF